jgi:RNA polymerase sigma-70 factor (ECF subfamily)
VERLFDEHAGRICSLACRMLPNEADAEDVTQEVLLQVVRKLDTFRQQARLSTWIHRISVNAVLTHRRRRARRPECQLPDVPEHVLGGPFARAAPATPEREVLGREMRRVIEGVLARLPRGYREVFVLVDVEGVRVAEAARLLGLGLPAVKSRLHRARLMLRQALAPHVEELAK